MARNYQPKKNNPYWLPHNVYMRVLYTIRDYPRMKSEQNGIIFTSPKEYSGAKSKHSDPTANKAIKISMMSKETDAVDFALLQIPDEYREAIWNNIVFNQPYKTPASRNTFRYWRSKLCRTIAEYLHYV